MVIPTRNNRAAVGNANRCHRIQCKQFTERKNKYDFLALQIEENKYFAEWRTNTIHMFVTGGGKCH